MDNRKKIILGLIVLPNVILANNQGVEGDKERKNIILIAFDDLRTELNCYGADYMHTPNFDKFASEGIMFNRAYCNIPVSGASRASLLTGTRPTRNAFLNFDTISEEQKPDKVGLNEYLQSLGYRTEVRGKVFHNPKDHVDGWDKVHTFYKPNYLKEENIKFGSKGAPYECVNVEDFEYAEGKRTLEALKDLETLSKSDKPFFYGFGFIKPHLPFVSPKKYWDIYDGKISIPDNYRLKAGNQIPTRALHNFGELRQYQGVPKKGELSTEEATRLIQGYRACVSYVDNLFGMIIDKIKELGLDKNSIIVMFGDHGWSLGEHGLWCKHTIFETMLNAPLIIYDASAKLNGRKCNEVVEFVDIFPTICEAIGVPVSSQAEGMSLLPLMNNENAKSKGYAVSRWMQGYTLITDDNLFYTEWWDKEDNIIERMLFDHNNDPEENYNVVNNMKYEHRINDLSNKLKNNRGKEFDKYSRKNFNSKKR